MLGYIAIGDNVCQEITIQLKSCILVLLHLQVWNEMEQIVHIGLPTPGSVREKMFKDYSEQFRSVIREAVRKKRSGEEQKTVPFMDSLLQSGAPDEQVRNYMLFSGLFSQSANFLDLTSIQLEQIPKFLIATLQQILGDPPVNGCNKYRNPCSHLKEHYSMVITPCFRSAQPAMH